MKTLLGFVLYLLGFVFLLVGMVGVMVSLLFCFVLIGFLTIIPFAVIAEFGEGMIKTGRRMMLGVPYMPNNEEDTDVEIEE